MMNKLKWIKQCIDQWLESYNRPNIALAIEIVARFFEKPRENHLMLVNKIMR